MVLVLVNGIPESRWRPGTFGLWGGAVLSRSLAVSRPTGIVVLVLVPSALVAVALAVATHAPAYVAPFGLKALRGLLSSRLCRRARWSHVCLSCVLALR